VPQSGSTLLGQLLNAFIFTLSGGYARSVGDVMFILTVLATIELTLAALAWVVARSNVLADLIWKVLGFAVLFWLVDTWPVLLRGLRDSAIEAGLLVGGSVLSVNDLTDPGNLVDFGFSVTALLFNKLAQLNLITNGFIVIIGGLAGWLVVLLYMVMSAHLFMALLEYYIVGACLLFLVPFLAYEKTAFAGERVFGTFVSHALRLLIYAAIFSAALPILYTYKLPNDPTLADTGMLLAGTIVMFAAVLSAPALASGAVAGAGAFSFGTLISGASGFARTSAAVGAVGAAASIAGASGLRAGLRGASALHAAAQMGSAAYNQSHPFTHASRQGRVASAVVGGAQGMGTYAVNRLTSGFRAAVQQGRASARNNMP
jgi:type IV secretion system protein TrbL